MQIKKSKSKTEYEFNTRNQIDLKVDEVEKKLLKRFNFLQEEKSLHEFFSSYDFRLEEKNMIEVWNQILDYLLTDIFSSFGASMSDLKKYTIVKNRIPVGLNNLIQQLRIEQKYITEEDLKDDKFYEFNFPDLYPKQKGYVSNFLSSLQSIINFTGGKMGCKEESDNNDENKVIRTDISEEEKNKTIPENSLIFNYSKFKIHCNELLQILKDILQENEDEVITTFNLKKIINERYIKKSSNEIGERINLKYGLQYIDYVLFYLKKIKKIEIFEISSQNINIECIKLLKNPTDTVTEKDEAIAKILIQIESLEKRINEYQKKVDILLTKAKEQLKKKNKQGAKTIMIKKKNYEKFLQNSQNTQNILEQQIFDIKNAENNASVTDILKQCVEAVKSVGMNADDFAEAVSDLKDVKDDLNEINTGMNEFVDEKDEEELNKEMENLMLENKKEKELEFPSANKENIDENKKIEDLIK